jgi:hypothetical protein
VGKAKADVSDDVVPNEQAQATASWPNAAGDTDPPADLTNSKSFVRGRNLPTAKSVSVGAAAVLVFLFALREMPELSYWLHLPAAVFTVLLIGGAVGGLLVRRRWGRLLPREPRLDIEHMEARAARREAILLLEKSAFRLLPTLAAIGVFTWLFLVQHNLKAVYFVVGFALVWNVISRPIWEASVLPLLRRG